MALILLMITLLGLYGPVSGTLWVAYGGSSYLFGHAAMQFSEAEEYCRQQGAHLVHVNSQQENIFLREYLRNFTNGNYWLGMTDVAVEGIWKWQDTDTKVTYSNWVKGEPDNYNNEDCAVLKYEPDYRWMDISCELKEHALCETSFGDHGTIG